MKLRKSTRLKLRRIARMSVDGMTHIEIAREMKVTRQGLEKLIAKHAAYYQVCVVRAAEKIPTPTVEGPLTDYAGRYLAERPGLSAGYKRLVVSVCEQLYRWAGGPLALEEIDRGTLAKFAQARISAGVAPSTVNGTVRRLQSILRSAFDDGLLDQPPRRVRRITEQHNPPLAWTVEECGRLFSHLDHLPGMVGSVPASSWWLSLAMVVYWTGARISSVRDCRVEDYRPSEGMTIRESKTGKGRWHPLPATCCERIDSMLPDEGPIWAFPGCRRTFWKRFREYVDAVGLPAPRGRRSLFYALRRTNASLCAAVDPNLAQDQLGHSSLAITKRHYIDQRIARQRTAADVLPDPMVDGDGPTLRLFKGV